MDRTIGVLGGGQLGRMLTEAANRLNITVITLDVEGSPAKQINVQANHVNGSFTDPKAIRQLAQKCDILTVEIEHVNTDVLEDLADGSETREDWRLVRSTKIEVQPSWQTIRVIQDKYKQKEHLIERGIETAESIALESNTPEELAEIASRLAYPLMLKSRIEAYDGRGNIPVNSISEIPSALSALSGRPLYAERWAYFKTELAVMVVKTKDESTDNWQDVTIAYPVVETVHEDSICKLVYAPARNVSSSVTQRGQELARRAVAGFWGKGVFGVELFLMEEGELLINEIAPRCHNSGHYTIEACPISQYDAHIRAILDLPITEEGTRLMTSNTNAIMLNILGGAQQATHRLAAGRALSIPGSRLHMYGKGDARPGRKMGHVTVIADSMKEAQDRIEPLIKLVDQIRASRRQATSNSTAISAIASNSPTLSQVPIQELHVADNPLVAVTMGSDSDRVVLQPGMNLLKELKIPHSVTITSAHRTPDRMYKFAREAISKGTKVIIAAAGGAAHLPGMIAALTPLPVIGVPVRGNVLDGQDSLLSIVQMPRGCPVATVAINNSTNAAQLAIRILATTDANIMKRLENYLADQRQTVLDKAEKLESTGIEAYSWED